MPAANVSPEAFRGTAEAYLRYRPPYPNALLDALVARVAGHERLLDLVCGPGRLAIPLSASFAEVYAIDLEPEMIATGRREAERRCIANIRWHVGRAETFDAQPESFDLIVIGEAFHRLDQRAVAGHCLSWLKPGGGLATLGHGGIVNGREPWQRVVRETLREWTGDVFPEGWANAAPTAPAATIAAIEALLRDTGFAEVESGEIFEPHVWSVAETIGYLRSTSVGSARVLGDKVAAFDAALTEALLRLEPIGQFTEELRFGFTFARKR